MISLEGVQRRYPTRHGTTTVLRDVNFRIEPGEKVGIVGRNGAGKSTMIRLLSGAEKPDAGLITRSMSVSWPLAFAGGFQGTLTGLDNLRFICRVYGRNWREQVAFVQDFTELGKFLDEPLKSYSSGMRSRLAFALSMVIDFDCFLIDEIMAVGDHRFHERCHIELFEKRADHAMVFVSHDADFVRSTCSRISVLEEGHLHNFKDLDEAYAFYYRPPSVLPRLTPLLNGPLSSKNCNLAELLFGEANCEIAELTARIGAGFTEWLLGHPLTENATVARHRLDKVLTPAEAELLQSALDDRLHDDFAGRSLHSALAALAENRPDCPISQHFLTVFEARLPMEGHDGLWHRMSLEAGSIRRAATFLHSATRRELPVRLDFHRAIMDDAVHNELAEFTMHPDGVTCRLRLCMSVDYLSRMVASYQFLLPYFANCKLSGNFDLSLGNEGAAHATLAFCSINSEFLVPDPLFISSNGYADYSALFAESLPWQQRKGQAYWRGTDSGTFRYREWTHAPRVFLALLSQAHPGLIDAKITNIERLPGWENKKEFYDNFGLISDPAPQDTIVDYKYQIDVDGNANSWSGLFLKLLTGSPVLKFESEIGFKQWYYDELVPWKHYVPINANGDDLIEKLDWLNNNPLKAERIGVFGREFALAVNFDDALRKATDSVAQLVNLNARLYNRKW